ncbi:MAG: restriction endonuclease subunit S, partial [Armatimonadota bacterium]
PSVVADVNKNTIDKNYQFKTIEYIDVASVEERKLIQTTTLKIDEAPSRAKRIVKDNSILISTVRPNLKHYCFIKKANPNLIASTGFAVINSKINLSDASFIYYLLTTDEYTEYLVKIADNQTSTYPAFNPSIIYNSKFLLPPLSEQVGIAGVLSAFDDKIELLREQNKTLEAIAQAIFKEWFVDFNFPDANGNPYKKSGGNMIDSELGPIPEGWRVGKYSDIVELTTGKGIHQSNLNINGLYPVKGANGNIGKTNEYLFDEELILTGRVGTLGTVYISRGKVWISDNVLISKPKRPDFLYFAYLHLKRINFDSLNRGSTQPLITQTDLNNVSIVIPQSNIFTKWSNLSNSLYDKYYINNSQIQTLSSLRDALLPKLMRGEVRVSEL